MDLTKANVTLAPSGDLRSFRREDDGGIERRRVASLILTMRGNYHRAADISFAFFVVSLICDEPECDLITV